MEMIEESLTKELFNEFSPVLKTLAATNAYSITLGGSYGKGTQDAHSDIDFRFYCETQASSNTKRSTLNKVKHLSDEWKTKGIIIDGVWSRTYAEVDEQLDLWLSGNGSPTPYLWTIWGYNILTDIYNQKIIEDPLGKALQWKERLSAYPKPLKDSILKKHGSSLKYWRNDYHYINKVRRNDTIFLTSLTSRLLHDIMQVVFALNESYYPGDGNNLEYSRNFTIKPHSFESKVAAIIQPQSSKDMHKRQYNNLIGLIDDLLQLMQ